jgi:DNA polymerase III delta prime subunit
LIDEVHMLSSHAFNAMLKTLEEPPDYLKFILATTDPQKVPATVLSRAASSSTATWRLAMAAANDRRALWPRSSRTRERRRPSRAR